MVTGMVSPDLNSPNKKQKTTFFEHDLFRLEFPALKSSGVYLDSASTSLKPHAMIDVTFDYYAKQTATVLRSLHQNAQLATLNIDKARQCVASLIHANQSSEIIWTRGTTESINLIAQSYARQKLTSGDEIIVSELEHHSNLLPWLIVAEQTGAKVIKWSLNHQELSQLITSCTKIVAITQMSNVTGYCPDIKKISDITHKHNAILVVDGAQGVVHQPIDVKKYDIDFYAFSAHKMYGPTGLGILYGKKHLLEQMPVWHGGGKMLKKVNFDDFQVEDLPYKFEAGTPNIAGILGFYATLNWMNNWDFIQAEHYTKQLADYTKSQLIKLTDMTLYSVAGSPIITFNINGIHHNDIALLVSEQNIAIRTGELCAQPLMRELNCQGVIRLSLMPYNNKQDIDKFILALQDAIQILK